MNPATTLPREVPTTDAVLAAMLATSEWRVKQFARQEECTVWRNGMWICPPDVEAWIRETYPTLRDFHELVAGRDWVLHLAEEVECELRLSPIKHGFSVEVV